MDGLQSTAYLEVVRNIVVFLSRGAISSLVDSLVNSLIEAGACGIVTGRWLIERVALRRRLIFGFGRHDDGRDKSRRQRYQGSGIVLIVVSRWC